MDTESSLMGRCALAYLRLEIGAVPPARLAEARKYLETAGEEFDGRRLIETCLEGRAADGDATLERAIRKLHASIASEASGRRPRRRQSFLVRFSATFVGRLLAFLITLLVATLVLAILQSFLPELDIYAIRDSLVDWLRGVLGK